MPTRCAPLGARRAGREGDAVFRVPMAVIEHDVGNGLLTRQHRRQQDAVIISVRLGPEYGDVVMIGRAIEQLLDGLDAGHAVANNDEFPFHSFGPCG